MQLCSLLKCDLLRTESSLLLIFDVFGSFGDGGRLLNVRFAFRGFSGRRFRVGIDFIWFTHGRGSIAR